MSKFDLVSKDFKETYVHSFKDIKFGAYGKLIWNKSFVDKFIDDFNNKCSEDNSKKIILVEPSYADSENALKYCSTNAETIIITIRPVLERICSHLIMDSRLGIINLNNLNKNKLFLERFHYYLALSNYSLIYQKLKSLGTNMDKVYLLDLKKRLIYQNGKGFINEELIKEIALKTIKETTNKAKVPKNKLIGYLYKKELLRKLSRIMVFKSLKDFFNNNFLKNIDMKDKQELEKLIYKTFTSSIKATEFQNSFLLSSKSIINF